MRYETKFLKFNYKRGSETLTFDFRDIHKSFVDVDILFNDFPGGWFLMLRNKFVQTQFIFDGSNSCRLLLFDEYGKFVSTKAYEGINNATASMFIQELFVLILPPEHELNSKKIISLEIDQSGFETIPLNKHGEYEHIEDQCGSTCTCINGCKLDQMYMASANVYKPPKRNN